MIYTVWKRLTFDGRAPSVVNLAVGYEELGTVEALGRAEALAKWSRGEDVDTYTKSFNLAVGDVLESENEAWILTPQRIWAKIDVFFQDTDENT